MTWNWLNGPQGQVSLRLLFCCFISFFLSQWSLFCNQLKGIFFLLVYCSNVYREIFPLLGTYVLSNNTMKLGHVSSRDNKLTGDLLLSPRRTSSVLRHWLHTKRYSRDPCSQARLRARAMVRVACG